MKWHQKTFALIDYSSSSKIEAQYIIRKGLDLMISKLDKIFI
jgi:hypothetical protein